jgi:hypothetical protein
MDVTCKTCKKKFRAKPSHFKLGWAKFCSRICANQAAKKGKEVACAICGEHTYRSLRDVGRSKSKKYFCGKSCQTLWRNQLYFGEKHSNFKHGTASYREKMRRSGIKKTCNLCKIADARVLAVHHIDQNRKNNMIENLIYLCHNCHHLVHRYPQERSKLG